MSDKRRESEDLESTQKSEESTSPAEYIGEYRILEKLGEGGMGTVYLAQQERPVRRRVALKVIKPGMDTERVIARFEAERQALAVMDHPNIARVYDAGATETGRPYFVMQLVRGVPITKACDQHRLTMRERLELFVPVCQAVQHAHQKGVIHRDLKPPNILVSVADDRLLPKIIDFGVAKATGQSLSERTLHTEMGALLGTPEYMSPEQAELSGMDVDTRTDIYSLGVVLYELITSALPFDSRELRTAPFVEMQRIIREVEPARPSVRFTSLGGEDAARISAARKIDRVSLARQLKGELDWIVMKALDKDRTRRYETANALALDIQRYLNNEPVFAGPPGGAYRVRKFVQRNRVGVATAAALLLLFVAGGVGTTVGLLRSLKAERLASRRLEQVKVINDFVESILLAGDPDEARGREITVQEILDDASRTIGSSLAGEPEHEAMLRGTIGSVFRKLGRFDDAEPHLLRAVELRRQALGAQHPDTLASMNNLALLYFRQAHYTKAEEIWSGLIPVLKRVLGPDHLTTVNAQHNLAAAYLAQDRYDDAEPLVREALKHRRRTLGEDNPRTLASLNNLAVLYREQERYREAEPLFSEVLEARRRVLGEDHRRTFTAMVNLGEMYLSEGRHAEAEPLLGPALEGLRRVVGLDHPHTLEALRLLAELRLATERLDEAEPLTLESYRRHLARYGGGHSRTEDAVRLLVRLYETSGQTEQASEWRSKLAVSQVSC